MADFQPSSPGPNSADFDAIVITPQEDSRPNSYRDSSRVLAAQIKTGFREVENDCCFTFQNCCNLQARANHRRTQIFHRISPLGFWFAIIILLTAIIVGVFTPHLEAINIVEGTAGLDVNSETIDFKSGLFWLVYFTWSMKWYIQAILNFTRGRTTGLSIDYVMWGLVATISQILAVGVADVNGRTIASFDTRFAVIDDKMYWYHINSLASVMIVLFQCWRYDGWNSQRPGALVRATAILAIIFTCFYVVVNMGIIQDKMGKEMAITRYIYACEIFALSISVFKFVPQIIQNHTYSIWIGVDIMALLFEFIGAFALFVLIFYSTAEESDFNFENFDTFKDVVNVEIRQLIQAIIIVFFCFILFAQLIAFWQMPTSAEMEQRVNERTERQAGKIHRPSIAMGTGHKHAQEVNKRHTAGGDHYHSSHTTRKAASYSAVQTTQPTESKIIQGENTSASDMNAAFGGSSTTAAAPAPKWQCPVCTYTNDSRNIYCAMCETPLEDVLDQLEGGAVAAGAAKNTNL